MTNEIPYMMPEDGQSVTALPEYPLSNLIAEIIDRRNMESAFDYVVSHLESANQRDTIRPQKKKYVDRLIVEIGNGTFRITEKNFRTLVVTDGPKVRTVQCPTVYHRVGCHAIMVVFEKHTYPVLITNTGASIKGRGMHWLFKRIQQDMARVPERMKYFYQCDIKSYYDSIDQELMKKQIREYTSDPVLLPILDNFIELLPKGLSKGLRSSQCFANLHLAEIDRKMCERVRNYVVTDVGVEEMVNTDSGVLKVTKDGKEIRYLYDRYCDDFMIYGGTKKELWELRNYLVELLAELNLTIKPSEAVRPIGVGCDFLGFVNYQTHARIRKRTKQKFARALHRVKSRKRRQKLIGSFFGMAKHCDSKHLMKSLLSPSEYKRLNYKNKMKEFGDFDIEATTLDGKKNFRGKPIKPRELDRQAFIVVDFETGLVPSRENAEHERRKAEAIARGMNPDHVEQPKSKYLLQIIYNGELRKMWTGDKEIWSILEQIKIADGFPFYVSIEMDYATSRYPKANFVSASKFGYNSPSDEQLAQLYETLNLKL